MLDVSVSYNRYKFLGHEFLTWMWFFIENQGEQLGVIDQELQSLEVGNRIVLENKKNTSETITIKGDDAGLEEGILALRKGAVVVEMNLAFQANDLNWTFSIKGESMSIGNLKVPETGPIETKDDIEGIILEKTYLFEKALMIVDNLFKHFIHLRVSNAWNDDIIPGLRRWVYS